MNLIGILHRNALFVLSSLVLHVWPQQTVPLCPDIPLSDPSPFTCTTLIIHSWSGSAFTNQCPSAMPAPDQIALNGDTLSTGTCGVFTGTVTSVDGNDVTSSLSFTPTQDMDGLLIECADGIGAAVSNFTIEITENLELDSVVDSTTTYGCVTATLASPTDTSGISNYRVEAILPGNGNVPSSSTSDDAADLEVEICGLNLCDESYTYRADANGGNICPSDVTSATLSLSTLGRIDSLRRRDRDTIEWDHPSNAPSDCTIVGYTISVDGLSSGTIITVTTTSNMVPMSDISADLDTCDSNLRITVVAEVATIGLVLASETNPAFNPTSAFPANPTVAVTGRPTYAISADDLTVIQLAITPVDEDVLQLFPDISRTVSYSGSQPLCGGSDTLEVQNNVVEVNSTCLEDMIVNFAVTFMDDPDCISNTINLASQSFPLIAGPDFRPNIVVTSESAEISVPLSTAVNVQANSFNVVGTATRAGNCATVTSDAATYPANAIFNDLESNTSYSFVIQIVSQATDRLIIGSFSGTFITRATSNMKLTTSEVIGITVVITFLVSFAAGGLVVGLGGHYYHIHKQRDKYFPRGEPQGEPAPMYEEVSTHVQPQNIELKENIAYGPVQ